MKLARFLPRFRRAYRELAGLEAREQLMRHEIEALQLDRLNAVWAHAIAHVPYYRRLAFEASLPSRFQSLAEYQAAVPVLPKQVVRDQPYAFLSERHGRGFWTRTGGSTGTPMNVFWTNAAHQEALRCKYRFYAHWGIDIFDPTAYLWGHSASFKPGLAGVIGRWWQPITDHLRNRLRLSAYQLGKATLRSYLQRIRDFRPAMLYGYSKALALLAQEAEASGIRCDSLRVAVLTGEPAFPNLVETIERGFSIPAVVEYGSIECGHLASERWDRTLRVCEDFVFMETLGREDGRRDIIVSVLNNRSFPLLRYEIGDVTDFEIERGNRGFARLFNVAGRNNDLIVSRSGEYLHSARFDALFKYETRSIRRFRVRQHSDGTLGVAVELNDPNAEIDMTDLQNRLEALVDYPATIEVVPELPLTLGGKHRLIVSDLAVASSVPERFRRAIGKPLPEAEARNYSHSFISPTRKLDPGADGQPADTATKGQPDSKSGRLRALIYRPELSFIMEAHNGLSARIVQEAGFEAIWASGLSMSAAMGVRDSNEASWTQVLEVLEFMSDVTQIPILVDGDTGYGNFNNMRRLVSKLEQRGLAGVCIEDKTFPKTNSFIKGAAQPLAEIEEFCGRIKAGKDAQKCDDFVIVARVEAFITGWGLREALHRAEAYRQAGADAILIHSALATPREVLEFKDEWGDRLPVIIVPTKFYSTPTEVFRTHGFSAIIWANHLMRSCISAMQQTAQQIFEEQNLSHVEGRIAPINEVFRLQGAHELEEAEKRYLPQHVEPKQIFRTEQTDAVESAK